MKKTLGRSVSFRPIEKEDIRYAWAAYKKGGLSALAEDFKSEGMNADEFREKFEATITTRYHGAWTIFADTKRGNMPVGFAVAFLMHPDPSLAPCMVLDQMLWMPWASARNRVEGAVCFFNRIRNEIPMITFAREPTKKFVVVLMRHGVLRQIGTSHTVREGESLGVYETRRT